MDGNITVHSEEGKGTSFIFNIAIKASSKNIPTYVCNNAGVLHGKTVLVVDDNSTNRKILKAQLEQWKLEPALASCGDEALGILLSRNDFDLIITDMQMPEMNGIQLARAIRNKYQQIPIILLSSIGDELRKDNPKLFSSILTKPIKQHILYKHVLGALKPEVKPFNAVQPATEKLPAGFSLQYPMEIMVAEDNPINQKLITHILNKLGYQPLLAENGQEALKKAKEQNFDLIFMDVQMPEMDGLEATRRIRIELQTQPIIIALTANAMQGDQDDCRQAGMDDYLSKPVKPEEVVSMLKKWAEHKMAEA